MIKEINMSGMPNKWLALMNHIRHSAPAVYQLTFPDSKSAHTAAKSIGSTIERNPTWFPMKVVTRGCVIYVIKENQMQKAVIKNE